MAIVDDSALVRQTLTEILSSDAGIEVVGAARDPHAAVVFRSAARYAGRNLTRGDHDRNG